MLGSGGGVELVAGVLGQQHDPHRVQVRGQRAQGGHQPTGGEHRDDRGAGDVQLPPRQAGVVHAQHWQHPHTQGRGDLLGLPPHRVQHAVHGVAVVPRRPVRPNPDVAMPGLGVDQEHPRWAYQHMIGVSAAAGDGDVVQ
jgi:hypothetical protein